MSDEATPIGLALRCDSGGTVSEVLYDTVGTELRSGGSLSEIVAIESVRSLLTVLTELSRNRAAPSRLGVIDVAGRRIWLSFIGCATGDEGEVLLVGGASSQELATIVEGLAAEVGEAADQLRWLSERARKDDEEQAAMVALSEATNELAGMHRELARKNAELELLHRRKDHVLGMVAHDLRNPLGSIAGFGAALERQLDDVLDDRSRLMLARIQKLSRRMLLLVEDLLDATAIASGQLTLDLTQVDIHQLLADTVDSHRHAAADKGVTLGLHCADRPARIWADPDRLAQVFDNLLSNAIRFSPDQEGATVTIRCRTIDAGQLSVTVTDEGVGMSDEALGRLFEPFSGTSPGTRDESGTGLGLAITRSIVEAHGGSIEVHSVVGEGTIFEVRLPVHPPSLDAEEATDDGTIG